MSRFNEYLEMIVNNNSIEFDSYDDFQSWRNRNGNCTPGIKIIIPNEHGNKVVYKSILDAQRAHEE